MPTLFVGLHLALAGLITLFGLAFLADPCGGGGDLCLGGVAGLFAFGVAGLGVLGLGLWRVRRRASPLLVWDCVLLASAGSILGTMYPFGSSTTRVGAELIAFVALPGAAMAGMAVMTHRIERLGAIGVFIGIAVLGGGGAIAVLGCGLVALAAGWLLLRLSAAEPEGPRARPPGEESRMGRPASP